MDRTGMFWKQQTSVTRLGRHNIIIIIAASLLATVFLYKIEFHFFSLNFLRYNRQQLFKISSDSKSMIIIFWGNKTLHTWLMLPLVSKRKNENWKCCEN